MEPKIQDMNDVFVSPFLLQEVLIIYPRTACRLAELQVSCQLYIQYPGF